MLHKDEIIHIAQLARIGLREDEIVKYQRELSLILDYFNKLEKADTDEIDPIGHITGSHTTLKEDEIIDSSIETKKIIFDNFPDKKNNQVKVKSILV